MGCLTDMHGCLVELCSTRYELNPSDCSTLPLVLLLSIHESSKLFQIHIHSILGILILDNLQRLIVLLTDIPSKERRFMFFCKWFYGVKRDSSIAGDVIIVRSVVHVLISGPNLCKVLVGRAAGDEIDIGVVGVEVHRRQAVASIRIDHLNIILICMVTATV